MDDQRQQQLDDELQQKEALRILERIQESCGKDIAKEAAYQMGVGTLWDKEAV